MTKEIQLTQGKVALVDDDWFDYLSQWKWFCDKGIYAARSKRKDNGKQETIYMHAVVANTPKGMNTDHIDMNGLNNQSYNLRVCTKSQNMGNINRTKTNTSGYSAEKDKREIYEIGAQND